MPAAKGKPIAVKTLRVGASKSEEWSRINMLGLLGRRGGSSSRGDGQTGCSRDSASRGVDAPPHDVMNRLFGSKALAKHSHPNQTLRFMITLSRR